MAGEWKDLGPVLGPAEQLHQLRDEVKRLREQVDALEAGRKLIAQRTIDVLVEAGIPLDGLGPSVDLKTGMFWRALGQVVPYVKRLREALGAANGIVSTVANWDTFGPHGKLVQAARRAEPLVDAALAAPESSPAAVPTKEAPDDDFPGPRCKCGAYLDENNACPNRSKGCTR